METEGGNNKVVSNFYRVSDAGQITSLIVYHNQNSRRVTIDTETTDKDARKARLIDIQMSGRAEGDVCVFDARFAHLLKDIDANIPLLAHNYKYDAHVLFRHGVDLRDRLWDDTLLLGHLCDENRKSYSLDSYVQEFWGDNYKERFWAGKQKYEDGSETERLEYGCNDIVYTTRLFEKLTSQREADGVPLSLYEHSIKLQRALLYTEIEGIKIDLPYLVRLGETTQRRIAEVRTSMQDSCAATILILEYKYWIAEMAKRSTPKGKARVKKPEFSFSSTRQLQDLLYGELDLPPQKNQKTRKVSTDFDCLEKIKTLHPVVALIQENRELTKIQETYIDGTLDRVEEDRVYPQFRVAGTVTGRLAHHSPNLGQLPKSGGVRGIYIPDPGSVFVSADYSQLEVVLEAHFTRDKTLLKMIENGESKHDVTARELKCDRSTAKTLNFALQYMCTAGKIAKLLGVSAVEGKKVYDHYWEVYSGSKRLKAETDRKVNEGEYIVNLFGRRRRFPVRPRNEFDGDYRQAYNFLIQSTGADITSRAFYLASEQLRALNQGRGLFTVHDELILEVRKEFASIWNEKLPDLMASVGREIGLSLPLKAEASGPCERWED